MDENTEYCEKCDSGPPGIGSRLKAYRYIYLKNRNKYPLPFIEYDVVFLDGNKYNLGSWNLGLEKN